jgi:hypothetical protein
MFNLSYYHFHFYPAGLYWSRRNHYQSTAQKLLGQSGTGFDDDNLPAAGMPLAIYVYIREEIVA